MTSSTKCSTLPPLKDIIACPIDDDNREINSIVDMLRKEYGVFDSNVFASQLDDIRKLIVARNSNPAYIHNNYKINLIVERIRDMLYIRTARFAFPSAPTIIMAPIPLSSSRPMSNTLPAKKKIHKIIFEDDPYGTPKIPKRKRMYTDDKFHIYSPDFPHVKRQRVKK
jgi:hypothetical protein